VRREGHVSAVQPVSLRGDLVEDGVVTLPNSTPVLLKGDKTSCDSEDK
jgi:hypothetical protein